VLAIEEFDFEDVARLRALDRDRARERVDGIEAHVRNVLNGGLDVDLAIDRVAALEPDDVAGFDGQNGVEAVVPTRCGCSRRDHSVGGQPCTRARCVTWGHS
jgi:hypothetical protein